MNRAFIPAAALVTFVAVYALTPPPAAGAGPEPGAEAEASDGIYYSGCNAVRADGRAPLYRGQPGYREAMDGDGDGIACEPHRGASASGGALRMRLRAGGGRRR